MIDNILLIFITINLIILTVFYTFTHTLNILFVSDIMIIQNQKYEQFN